MAVVVGVDGAGRTYRLGRLVGAARAWWVVAGVELEAGLAAARADGSTVVVDDAHRFEVDALRVLAAAARGGVPVMISRRPTIDSPELAALDEAAASSGGVELAGPLGRDEVAALVAKVSGRPVSPEVAAAVRHESGGLAAVAAALASTNIRPAPPLVARVQRRFAVLPHGIATVARVLALRLALPDDVLAAAAEIPAAELPATLRVLRDEGLLVPDGERMIIAVADAVLGELSAAERRRLHDGVARGLLATNADPVDTATQLRAAGVRTPAAAEIFRRAGEVSRFADPAAALAWFDDAADAGADPADVTAGRAEASALLGLPVDVDPRTERPEVADRLARLAGAAAAHDGRAERAADTLLTAAPALAVPVLVGVGRLDQARAALPKTGGALFAEAALTAAEDPDAAVPLLIEAAEAAERAVPTAVLPDTPHAVGAVVAVAVGDVAAAEHLLDRARVAGFGGPAAAERHRLLLAWARMRAGRYDTALTELARPETGELPGRERLLRAAIAAGIARR
ncbi:MAG TPA: hypothetical protein VNP92_08395, partial [Actinophytocola sp.]|nr:hypothetical protein [Actinophytocola sp.]